MAVALIQMTGHCFWAIRCGYRKEKHPRQQAFCALRGHYVVAVRFEDVFLLAACFDVTGFGALGFLTVFFDAVFFAGADVFAATFFADLAAGVFATAV